MAVGWGMYSWVGGGGWGVGWDNNVTGSLGLPPIRHATLLDVLLDPQAYVMLRYVLLDFYACVSYLRFLMKWASGSHLHDHQEDERQDDDI